MPEHNWKNLVNRKVVSATENLKKYPKVDKSARICRGKYFPFEFWFLML